MVYKKVECIVRFCNLSMVRYIAPKGTVEILVCYVPRFVESMILRLSVLVGFTDC